MTDDDSMQGFGVFAGDGREAFVTGVKEARERMDREFEKRGADRFGE